MSQYITKLDVSLDGQQEQQLQMEGFTRIDVNLNKESTGSPIYIWYMNGSDKAAAITRIQFSFNNEMANGLIVTGFQKVDKNLKRNGNTLYLWYYRGSSHFDVPIVELRVYPLSKCEDESSAYWYPLFGHPNSQDDKDWILLWVKKEKLMYLCDVTATNTVEPANYLFQQGYTRIDAASNTGAGGISIFIWFRLSTESEEGITEISDFDVPNYIKVNQDLVEGTGERPSYVWYTRDPTKGKPIKAISLLPAAVGGQHDAGIPTIPISGVPINLCVIR